eukprot:c4621_g1_i1.p1 GENE.c4621_g1_i1~~c4621_g1_i1.p1  ORF type:complete len:119 (+),score=14.01 c4621_g1_i1:225-581(+)
MQKSKVASPSKAYDVLGCSDTQVKRSRALFRLGASNDDFERLVEEKTPVEIPSSRVLPMKALRNLGMTPDEMMRAKALKVLGTSEQDLFGSEILEPTCWETGAYWLRKLLKCNCLMLD